MTDEQAERGIRELRGVRIGLFMVGAILAVSAGLKLGESLGPRDSTAALQAEVHGLRLELQVLRDSQAQLKNLPPFAAPAPKVIATIPADPK
jgi:hypothetical protein